MRKFFGYLALVITVVLLALLNVQGQVENLNYGLEYGNAYQAVYRLDREDSSKSVSQIADIIEQRLEDAKVRNSNVTYEHDDEQGDYQIKINVNSNTTTDLEYILRSTEATGTISVSTIMDGGDFGKELVEPFKKGSAKVDWSGSTPYVKVDIENYDEFNQFVSACNDAWKEFSEKYNSENQDTSNVEGVIVLWLDKLDTDTYIEAYQNTDSIVQEQIRNKILTIVPTSYVRVEKNASDEVTSAQLLIDRYDYGQTQLVGESAHTIERILNYEAQDFKLTRLYVQSVPSTYPSIYGTLALVGLGLAVLLVSIFYIVKYRLAGVAATSSLILTTFISLVVFNFFGYSLTTMVILAFAISLSLNLTFTLPYLEDLKNEMYKGKSSLKAHQEAIRSSRWTLLDGTIATVLVSTISIFVSINQVKLLPISILIASLSNLIFARLFVRWPMWWLLSSKLGDEKKGLGLQLDKIPNASKDEKQEVFNKLYEKDFSKKGKVSSLVALIVSCASAVILLVTSLVPAFNGTFRYTDEFKSSTVVEVSTEISTQRYLFSTKAEVESFFEREYNLKPTYISINVVNDVILEGRDDKPTIAYVSVEFDQDISFRYDELNNKIHALDYGENAVVYVSNSTSVTPKYILTYSIVALLMFGLILSVYYIFRFKYSFGLASLMTVVPSGLLAISFFSITRIATSPLVLMGIASGLFIGALSQLPLIERIKKLQRESKIKNKDFAFRQDTIMQGMKDSMHIVLKLDAAGLVLLIAIGALLPVNLYTVFGGAVIALCGTSLLTMFLLLPLYLKLEKFDAGVSSKFRAKHQVRRETRNKRKLQEIKEKHKNAGSEPTESIIPGIND